MILKTVKRRTTLDVSSSDFKDIYHEIKDGPDLNTFYQEKLKGIGLNKEEILAMIPSLISGAVSLWKIYNDHKLESSKNK